MTADQKLDMDLRRHARAQHLMRLAEKAVKRGDRAARRPFRDHLSGPENLDAQQRCFRHSDHCYRAARRLIDYATDLALGRTEPSLGADYACEELGLLPKCVTCGERIRSHEQCEPDGIGVSHLECIRESLRLERELRASWGARS